MKIHSIDHVNLTVSNLERSISFYGRAFGFSVVERGVQDGEPWAILRSGDSMVALYEHQQWEKPVHWTKKQRLSINHFGIRVDDRQMWEETLRRERLEVAYGGEMQRPHSTSWYVVDPSGHEIEVTHWNDGVDFTHARHTMTDAGALEPSR